MHARQEAVLLCALVCGVVYHLRDKRDKPVTVLESQLCWLSTEANFAGLTKWTDRLPAPAGRGHEEEESVRKEGTT